ncbi:MAG: cation:dicarboxylase symporter family transporter [Bacteroidales bacterium]|nr:cation:dicarboxylase symporter family transporter [Bacteroidales bacterium]
MKISQRNFLLMFFGVLTVIIILHFIHFTGIAVIDKNTLLICRIIALLFFVWYAFRKKSLTTWILISMLLGAEFGHDLPLIAIKLQLISRIFLNMIKTIIAPLIFATLVVGVAGHSNMKQVGRMGWKSLLYFEVVSTIAIFIGLLAINISEAGLGVVLPQKLLNVAVPEAAKVSTENIILNIFPENIAKAIYEGNILQVVVFSIFFGFAITMLKEKQKTKMISFTEGLSETMFKFTNIVMYMAPVAVFAAIASSVGHMGIEILLTLFKLLATLYVALLVFFICVFLPIMLFLKIPVRKFLLAISEPATIAFATTSSESEMPRAMEAMEKFGVPRKIVAFVMPMGYSFNLDGTSLYLSLATIFIAQLTGVHLSLDKQLLIVFTLMLTSKGVAGVPRASLVILLGTATHFGLPTWPIFIILGIDELMDMGRTTINLIGNCLATAVIARWEEEFDFETARNFKLENISE